MRRYLRDVGKSLWRGVAAPPRAGLPVAIVALFLLIAKIGWFNSMPEWFNRADEYGRVFQDILVATIPTPSRLRSSYACSIFMRPQSGVSAHRGPCWSKKINEKVFQYAESADPNDSAWGFSDRGGLKQVGSTISEFCIRCVAQEPI